MESDRRKKVKVKRAWIGRGKRGESIMEVIQTKVCKWIDKVFVCQRLLYCRLRFGRNIGVIPLTKFKFAIVDAEDYERLNKFKWHARFSTNAWYAVRCARVRDTGCNSLVWMHHVIMPPPKGMMVDHGNHNGLDNRRENLRLATRAENMQNRRKWKGKCSSRYKGVVYRRCQNRRKLWNAYINVNGRRINLGCFMTELEAAKAYDEAAKKYHGKFACLNFPEKKHKFPKALRYLKIPFKILRRAAKQGFPGARTEI